MADDVLWIRLGDASDYEAFDDLDGVADLFAEFSIKEVSRYGLYGVSASGFRGHNYISLYWGPDPGDGSAEASRELTGEELMELNRLLDARHTAYVRWLGR